MDWHMLVLVVAIVATWLAWRHARRQNELERARTAHLEEPRWRYRLVGVPAGDGLGPGYDVVDATGAVMDAGALDWQEQGVGTLDVDADPSVPRALQDAAFDAGGGIRLIRRDGAVEVWDEGESVRAGELDGVRGAWLARLLDGGDLTDCIVLRQAQRGEGGSMRLLLVHRDTDVEV